MNNEIQTDFIRIHLYNDDTSLCRIKTIRLSNIVEINEIGLTAQKNNKPFSEKQEYKYAEIELKDTVYYMISKGDYEMLMYRIYGEGEFIKVPE